MKLFYIANISLPTQKAHGLQIMKMCQAFAHNGLEVELLIPSKKNAIPGNIFDFYGVGRDFKIKKLFFFNFPVLGFLGRLAIYLQALVFAFSVFFYVLLNPKKLNGKSVFYLRDEFSPWFLAILNKKIFLEIHAFHRRLKYYQMFFSKVSGWILITQKAKEEFVGLGIKKEKILVSPDAVDMKVFDINISSEQARKELNLPQDKRILVYTGKFTTMGMDKGISDTLKAIKIIGDPGILFIGVGGSSDEIIRYQKQAQDLNVENQVIFINHKTQPELAIYQKAADVLLMPFPYHKHYAFYMSPLKMFEYMAARRPLVATDLPATREILNENNAFLAKPDSPEDLAKVLKMILDSFSLAQKIAQQAFLDAQKYTWEKRTEEIIKFINQRR